MMIVRNSFGDLVVFSSANGAYLGMAYSEYGKWATVVAAAPEFPIPASSKEEAFRTLLFMLETATQPMQ